MACLALGAAVLLAGAPAEAALGGSRDSVDADRIHLAARLASTAMATHTVHTLTLANGTVIREFARSDGAVFAISWRGRSRPDLRQLLGSRFDTLQSDNTLPGGRRTRHPLAVKRSDFILSSGGHSGAFHGFAILPGMAPAGFSNKDLS
jgi:hypothetical protein